MGKAPLAPPLSVKLGKKVSDPGGCGGLFSLLDTSVDAQVPGRLAAMWSRRLPHEHPLGAAPATASAGGGGSSGATTASGSRGGGGAAAGKVDEAFASVHAHLAEVKECMRQRQPTRLEAALSRAQGAEYMKAMAAVRRSKSTSDLHRHALESAMASHLVQAKASLARWQQGLREIHEAARLRDPDALRDRLKVWHFSEDEPMVQAAQEDLVRWQMLRETLPQRFQDGVERLDIPQLKRAMRDLSKGGPRVTADLPGIVEARFVLSRYEVQERALKVAIDRRLAVDAEVALASWEFDSEDPICVKAREMLERRDAQRADLQAATSGTPPNGLSLGAACESWEFEQEDAYFSRASEHLARFMDANAELQALVAACSVSVSAEAAQPSQSQSQPPSPSSAGNAGSGSSPGAARAAASRAGVLASPSPPARARTSSITSLSPPRGRLNKAAIVLLREKVDTWEFAEGPESGCPAMHEARDILNAVEADLRTAIGNSDGWLLHRLWVRSCAGASLLPFLSGDLEGMSTAMELLDGRASSAAALQRLLVEAPGFEAHVEAEVTELATSWPHAWWDPALLQAKSWLKIRFGLAERGATELRAAVAARCHAAARGVLIRHRDLFDTEDGLALEAEKLRECGEGAQRVAVALGLGTPASVVDTVQAAPPAISAAVEAHQARRIIWTSLTEDVIDQARALEKAPPGVSEVFQVAARFLVGISSLVLNPPPPPPSGPTWKMLLLDAPELMKGLAQVPEMTLAGQRANVKLARQARGYIRGPRGKGKRALWNVEELRKTCEAAAVLLEFTERMFRCDSYLDRAEDQCRAAVASGPAAAAAAEAAAAEALAAEAAAAEAVAVEAEAAPAGAVAAATETSGAETVGIASAAEVGNGDDAAAGEAAAAIGMVEESLAAAPPAANTAEGGDAEAADHAAVEDEALGAMAVEDGNAGGGPVTAGEGEAGAGRRDQIASAEENTIAAAAVAAVAAGNGSDGDEGAAAATAARVGGSLPASPCNEETSTAVAAPADETAWTDGVAVAAVAENDLGCNTPASAVLRSPCSTPAAGGDNSADQDASKNFLWPAAHEVPDPQAARLALGPALTGSRELAAAWTACDGANEMIENCVSKARDHARQTRREFDAHRRRMQEWFLSLKGCKTLERPNQFSIPLPNRTHPSLLARCHECWTALSEFSGDGEGRAPKLMTSVQADAVTCLLANNVPGLSRGQRQPPEASAATTAQLVAEMQRTLEVVSSTLCEIGNALLLGNGDLPQPLTDLLGTGGKRPCGLHCRPARKSGKWQLRPEVPLESAAAAASFLRGGARRPRTGGSEMTRGSPSTTHRLLGLGTPSPRLSVPHRQPPMLDGTPGPEAFADQGRLTRMPTGERGFCMSTAHSELSFGGGGGATTRPPSVGIAGATTRPSSVGVGDPFSPTWSMTSRAPLLSPGRTTRGRLRSPSPERGADPITEYIAIMTSFHEDFIPFCVALVSAAAAAQEAAQALGEAERALDELPVLQETGSRVSSPMAIWKQKSLFRERQEAAKREQSRLRARLPENQANLLPPGPGGADALGDFERCRLIFAAHLVERTQRAGRIIVEDLVTHPPEPEASARLLWADALLDANFGGVIYFKRALFELARELQPEEILADLDGEPLANLSEEGSPCNAYRTFLLARAVLVVVAKCDGEAPGGGGGDIAADVTALQFATVRQRVADAKGFTRCLTKWSPLEDGLSSQDGLLLAGPTLLQLWPWYAEGCGGNDETRRLFSWAALATALAPLLPRIAALKPYRDVVAPVANRVAHRGSQGLDTAASGEAAEAWADVREALLALNPTEPWWWLRACGVRNAEWLHASCGFAGDTDHVDEEEGVSEDQEEEEVYSQQGPPPEARLPVQAWKRPSLYDARDQAIKRELQRRLDETCSVTSRKPVTSAPATQQPPLPEGGEAEAAEEGRAEDSYGFEESGSALPSPARAVAAVVEEDEYRDASFEADDNEIMEATVSETWTDGQEEAEDEEQAEMEAEEDEVVAAGDDAPQEDAHHAVPRAPVADVGQLSA